jgi:hypothetical protein
MRILIAALLLFLLFSCSGTKHLPPGEALYLGTREVGMKKVGEAHPWTIRKSGQKKALVYWTLWDLPNGSFGFPQFRLLPTRLIIYNWFYNKKEKGFSHWMRNNFGEPPITVNSLQPALKTEKVVNMFENWGHFGTTGTFSVRYNRRKTKGAIFYKFQIARAYRFRFIEFTLGADQAALKDDLESYKPLSIIQADDDFDLSIIQQEKLNLWTHLQNTGHFYLRQDNIEMAADTTVGNKQMDFRIGIQAGLPQNYYSPLSISAKTLSIDSILQDNTDPRYYRWASGKMRKKVFDSLVNIRTGNRYELSKIRRSMHYISEVGIFVNPLISFHVSEEDSLHLDAVVTMKSADATTIKFNAKGNYRSTGYIGPSLGLNLTQLNVFGGAENLSVDADAYYNFPIGAYGSRSSNSSGFSLRTTITAPALNGLFGVVSREYSLPKKFINLNAEFNDRKNYFTIATWNVGYGFTWKSHPKITHRLSLVDATYSNIINSTPKFDSLISESPSLRTSISNQFIFGSSYSFKYDNSSTEDKLIGTYFEGKLELAGNTMYLLSLSGQRNESGQREGLGIAYSQFAQASYDFRTYLRMGRKSQLAFRHIGGIGLPYGNSHRMPYIRQFFIGGTNSLRPISARTVGPGRYLEFNQQEVNQVGDLKLEWNLEYRFPLGAKLSGALWSDAGNIWLLQEDPSRPNSQIRWKHVFGDSYLTAGVGLRLNVNFLILRADYGGVLYIPVLPQGYKWIWQNKLPFYPVIGFGLPF